MGIFDLHASKSVDQHENLSLVRVDHSSGCGGFWCNDVHVRVEGIVTQRGDMEGTKIRGKVAKSILGGENAEGVEAGFSQGRSGESLQTNRLKQGKFIVIRFVILMLYL